MSDPLPTNIFSTTSPLVASWLDYAHRINVRFLRYEPETHLFHFWDPDGLTYALINDYNQVDPTVNLRQFYRSYNRMLAEKMRQDGRRKQARREAAGGREVRP